MERLCRPGLVSGHAQAPASKSAMQRALACAALAGGRSILRNPCLCDDTRAAMGVIRALGASVDEVISSEGNFVAVGGSILNNRRPERLSLSCGESGLCMRMFSALCCLWDAETELAAGGSLCRRSMAMVEASLASMGLRCASSGGLPPLTVRGPLRPGTYRLEGSESSQFITGLLLALPMAGGSSTLMVSRAASRGYLALTQRVMEAFGVRAVMEERACSSEGTTDLLISIEGGQYRQADYTVESDYSGAAFLMAAACVTGGTLCISGLDPESSQPDKAMLRALALAGARAEFREGILCVEPGSLRGFSFDATDCPDLFPPLATLAARCEGSSRFRGVHRLRGKESDRANALCSELGKLGLPISVEGDELVVRGLGPKGRLSGGRVLSHGDHRIAMAAAVAALRSSGDVLIEGAECVAKSWPSFFNDLARFTVERS